MPSWKKIIQSGSRAELSQLTASDGIQSAKISGSKGGYFDNSGLSNQTASFITIGNTWNEHSYWNPATGAAQPTGSTSEIRFQLTADSQSGDNPGLLSAGKITAGKQGWYDGGSNTHFSNLKFYTAFNGEERERMIIQGGNDSSPRIGIGTAGEVPVIGVTVQGNVSASGIVYAAGFSNSTGSDISVNDITASGNIWVSGSATKNIYLGDGHITASGNISSSGTGTNYFGGDVQFGNSGDRIKWNPGYEAPFITGVNGNTLTLDSKNIMNFYSDTRFIFHDANVGIGIGNINPTHALEVSGSISASGDININDITASGDISSSATIKAEHFYSSDNIVAVATVQGARISAVGSRGLDSTAISASGDISASSGIILGGVRRTTWPSGGGGGGTGIFNPTGSKMATTNTVEITGSLKVSGSSTLTNIGQFTNTGDVTITGDVRANNYFRIKPVSQKKIEISGSLVVSGSSTFTNIGTFKQTGDSTMSGSVYLVPKAGEVFTFRAGDFVQIKKPISGIKEVQISGSLRVSGSNSFKVEGPTQLTGSFAITKPDDSGNDLIIDDTGFIYSGSKMRVTGSVEGTGNMSVGGTLSSTGNLTIGNNKLTINSTTGTLTSQAAIIAHTSSYISAGQIKGDKFVPRLVEAQIGEATKRINKLYMSSQIIHSGSLSIGSDVDPDGTTTITGSLSVSGSNTFKVEGPTQLTGSFAITKPDDGGNDLIIDDTGFIYSGSKMRVTGSVEGTGNMDIGGTLSVDSNVTVGNNKLTINSTTGTLTSQAAIVAHTSSYISAGIVKGDKFIPRDTEAQIGETTKRINKLYMASEIDTSGSLVMSFHSGSTGGLIISASEVSSSDSVFQVNIKNNTDGLTKNALYVSSSGNVRVGIGMEQPDQDFSNAGDTRLGVFGARSRMYIPSDMDWYVEDEQGTQIFNGLFESDPIYARPEDTASLGDPGGFGNAHGNGSTYTWIPFLSASEGPDAVQDALQWMWTVDADWDDSYDYSIVSGSILTSSDAGQTFPHELKFFTASANYEQSGGLGYYKELHAEQGVYNYTFYSWYNQLNVPHTGLSFLPPEISQSLRSGMHKYKLTFQKNSGTGPNNFFITSSQPFNIDLWFINNVDGTYIGDDSGVGDGGNDGSTLSGDVDQDGSITILDIVQIAQHILGEETLTGQKLNNADFNGDGSVDVTDLLEVVNLILSQDGTEAEAFSYSTGTDNKNFIQDSRVSYFSTLQDMKTALLNGSLSNEQKCRAVVGYAEVFTKSGHTEVAINHPHMTMFKRDTTNEKLIYPMDSVNNSLNGVLEGSTIVINNSPFIVEEVSSASPVTSVLLDNPLPSGSVSGSTFSQIIKPRGLYSPRRDGTFTGTGTSTGLIVRSDNRVGIGTARPTALLHISSSKSGSRGTADDLMKITNKDDVNIFKVSKDSEVLIRNAADSSKSASLKVDSSDNLLINDVMKVNHKEVIFKSGSTEVKSTVDPSSGQIKFKKSDGTYFAMKGAEIETKDSTGKIVKEVFENGKKFTRSGSSTANQVELQQNAQGAFISVSGSTPGYNIIKTGEQNEYRLIRQTSDMMYSDPAIFTVGIDSNDKMWFVNPSISGVQSNAISSLRVSSSGDSYFKGDASFGGGLIVSGAIQANSMNVTHFTSSFITASTIQTSGSNIFGDESTDTHKFVGDITASGKISSSGNIYGSTYYSSGEILGLNHAGIMKLATGANPTIVRGSTITLSANITASGNISSSGQLIAASADFNEGNITNVGSIDVDNVRADANTNTRISVGNTSVGVDVNGETSLTITETKVSLNDTITEGLFVDSHITASGNISASGTGTHRFGGITQHDRIIVDDISIDGSLISDGGALTILATDELLLNSSADRIRATANITASGDISSSGTILATNGFVANGNSLFIGNLNVQDTYLTNLTASSDISSSGAIIGDTATFGYYNGNISASGGINAGTTGVTTANTGHISSSQYNLGGYYNGSLGFSHQNLWRFSASAQSNEGQAANLEMYMSGVRVNKLTTEIGGTSFFGAGTNLQKFGFNAGTAPQDVGITVGGQISASGNLEIDGNATIDGVLTATRKSFLIPHPTDEGKKLQYASLEGPENGVYLRGKLKGKNIIELPEYWSELIDEDTITVSLTSIGRFQYLYVRDISSKEVMVGINQSPIRNIYCHYVIYAERKDIDKLEVEI